MVLSLSIQQSNACFGRLKEVLAPVRNRAEAFFLDLGGIRTVKILACDSDAVPMIRRQLAWTLTDPVPDPDATLVLWKESVDTQFHNRVLGLDVPDDGSITYFGNFVYSDGFAVRPALWVELKSNDSNTGLGNDVIDGQEGSDSTDSTDTSRYIVGETYTVQTNLRVRKGPGKEYGILKRSELTSEDYAKSVDTKTDAVIAKGSRITCLEMSGNWMRISSGWVCVEDEGEILVK